MCTCSYHIIKFLLRRLSHFLMIFYSSPNFFFFLQISVFFPQIKLRKKGIILGKSWRKLWHLKLDSSFVASSNISHHGRSSNLRKWWLKKWGRRRKYKIKIGWKRVWRAVNEWVTLTMPYQQKAKSVKWYIRASHEMSKMNKV